MAVCRFVQPVSLVCCGSHHVNQHDRIAAKPGDTVTQDDLLLAAGTRLLHIGPHKTGSTMVQGAFYLARDRLAGEGVFYPGKGRQPLASVLAVTNQPPLLGDIPPKIEYWNSLVRSIDEAGDQRVVLSSEFFDEADDATARRVLADLGGPRVHVVVTLRPLTKIIPSQWQQYLQNGYTFSYLEWLEGILSDPPVTPTPGFWRRHRHDELIARWAAAVGPDNLTVIVTDEADPMMLLRTFEAMLGLPSGFLVPQEDTLNRSLTLAEAEFVRLLNQEYARQGWPDRKYPVFVRDGVVARMKAARAPAAGEQKIVTPAWAVERAASIGAEMTRNILALGVRVVGDISILSKIPPGTPEAAADHGAGASLIPAEAAVLAVAGAFGAGGVGGLPAEDVLSEIQAKVILRVLLNRGKQRLRRKLPAHR
jgi:hypothetical protein